MADYEMNINNQKTNKQTKPTHPSVGRVNPLLFWGVAMLLSEIILKRKFIRGEAAALKHKALRTQYHRKDTCQKLQQHRRNHIFPR